MKKENGITLVSLVIYVVLMIMIVSIMGIITGEFYKNTSRVQGNVDDIIEFNKFNMYFLREIKATGNKVEKINDKGINILFSSGNSFILDGNVIYYNNIPICENVTDLEWNEGLNGDGKDKSIIHVTLKINESIEKKINYKIEKIY